MLSNKDFFDSVSVFYDKMIDFDSALERRKRQLSHFIGDSKIAADVGCGSGIDSIALSSLGLTVDAFDISQQMIFTAKKNAANYQTSINFFNYPIHDIPDEFNHKYSMITSLGNTLSNLNSNELVSSVKRIFDLLEYKGKILIQILNYDYLLQKKERIVNITADKKNHFIRFYDFNFDHIQFNILRYSNENTSIREMISTKLYPHSPEIIKQVMIKAGFTDISIYGDLNKNKYMRDKSTDLVIYSERP